MVVLKCSPVTSLQKCAQTVGLIGSQRADLSPLKINTVGYLPSGFCHRLHSLKPRPDPGCARVTAPAPSTIWTPHLLLSLLLPSSLLTHHTRRLFSLSDMHSSTLVHAQISVSGSLGSIKIINTSDQDRCRFAHLPMVAFLRDDYRYRYFAELLI